LGNPTASGHVRESGGGSAAKRAALLVAVLEERDKWDAVRNGSRRGDLLASLVEYNAMRPGIIQTFSALLGESVTEGHPARENLTDRCTDPESVDMPGAFRDFLRLLGETAE
jgi:hypothetical protein